MDRRWLADVACKGRYQEVAPQSGNLIRSTPLRPPSPPDAQAEAYWPISHTPLRQRRVATPLGFRALPPLRATASLPSEPRQVGALIPAPSSVTYSAAPPRKRTNECSRGRKQNDEFDRPARQRVLSSSGPRDNDWWRELAALRLKQLTLLHEENMVLQAELDISRVLLKEKEELSDSLERSLDIFGDIVTTWLKQFSSTESRKILETFVKLLEKYESNDELCQHMAKDCQICSAQTERQEKLIKERLDRASAQIEQSRPDPTPPTTAADSSSPLKPPRAPSVRGKIPPLKLGSVGRGTWLAGQQTSGDTYAPD